MTKRLIKLLTACFIFATFIFGFSACFLFDNIDSSSSSSSSINQEIIESEGLEYILVESEFFPEPYYAVIGLGSCLETDLVIPSTYNNLPVSIIASSAFEGCSNITSVVIPDSILGVQSKTFKDCTSLKSVVFSNNTTAIGSSTFENCTSLTNVTFSTSLTSIGDSAFKYCASLTEVVLPDGVKSISNSAFLSCHSLEYITVPESVTFMGNYALASRSDVIIYCEAESEPHSWAGYWYDDKATIVWNYSGVKDVTENGIVWAQTKADTILISDYVGEESEVIIPETLNDCPVTKICPKTFQECNTLKRVTLPDNVTSIGDMTFANCSNLTTVTFGNGLANVDSSIFSGCKNLTSIYYTGDVADWCNITFKDSLLNSSQENDVQLYMNGNLVTELIIPDSVTAIHPFAFANFTNPTKIVIGDNVTSIGDSAFKNCNNVTSIAIGKGVKSIGTWVFADCSAVAEINYNATKCETLIYNNYTFYNTGSQKGFKLTIGANVQEIPERLFDMTVTTFSQPTYLTELVFESGSVCQSIGDAAFNECDHLTSVTIPDSVVSIGNYAFQSCTAMKSVTFGKNLTTIGLCAFDNCESLTNIVIPDNVTFMDHSAFNECSALKSVTLGNGLTSLSSNVFSYCSQLSNVTLGNKITSIGSAAFYYCKSLKRITIPKNVTSIDVLVFSHSNLTEAFFENTSGWSLTTFGTVEKTISSSELKNYTNAASYLKTYDSYTWKRS